MVSDCRRKIAPALSLAPGLLRRRNIEQQIVSKNLFFPVLFETGLDRLFSVSSAVNYVAPRPGAHGVQPSRDFRPRDVWPLLRDGARRASNVLMLSCDALKLSLTCNVLRLR